jgi:prepilin-type N-terminal cleavage/methylation domain-containing protein
MNRQTFKRSDRRAFTLIEIMVAVTVLVIALVGLFSALVTGMQLRRLNEEKSKVRNAAEQKLSSLRGMPTIVDAYGRFGGGGEAETFFIHGLADPSPTEPAGRIIVWRNKTALKNRTNPPQPDPDSTLTPLTQQEILDAQASLSQSFLALLDAAPGATGTAWTDFLNTNGDTVVDAADDPQLMPVTVRIRWRTRHGVVTQYFSTIIGNR